MRISIHAPVKGATTYAFMTVRSIIDFNSRSREGSDMLILLICDFYSHFNSRSREGSDQTHLKHTY